MHTDSVLLHSAALTTRVSQKSFSEGSSVFVRVLKNNGNNSFTVSFAGNRFDIKSDLSLKEGSAFFANIKLENGKIFLVQQHEKAVQSANVMRFEKLFDSDGNIKNPVLQQYFINLGLPPDNISYSLMEALKSLGAKYNSFVMKKALRISKNFAGNEKNAAQVALILLEKGIDVSEDEVQAILGEKNQNPFKNKEYVYQDFSSEKELSSLFKNFFSELLENSEESKAGLLSIFNHTGFSSSQKSFSSNWIKIPFTYSCKKSGIEKEYSAFLSIFINPALKEVEKCVLKIQSDRDYRFVLYFNRNKCEKILSSINLTDKDFSGIQIEYCDAEELTDFDCSENLITLINGEV